MLATIAVPTWRFFKRQTIVEQLNQLQIICATTQQRATNTQIKQIVSLDSSNQSYFFSNHSEKLFPEISFGFIAGLKGPPSNPKKLVTQAITFPDQAITFYPDGTISAGTLYLTNRDKQQYALTVPISKETFVRKYQYLRGQWISLK